jgi:glucose-6-phosphate-specific signal transduction histidine kinase
MAPAARIQTGPGFAGSPTRVAAQGGTLLVVTPTGGGTTVRVDLPCVLRKPNL